MWRGLSLANKCLLLFGVAVILIVLGALSVPWLRMTALIDGGQLELSRQMVNTWETLAAQPRGLGIGPLPTTSWAIPTTIEGLGGREEHGGVVARRLSLDQASSVAATDPFIGRTVALFRADPGRNDVQESQWSGTTREYRYAKADRGRGAPGGGKLVGVILLERRSVEAARLLFLNSVYLLSAGAVVLGCAMLAVYVIVRKLILQPVKALKGTAERVREGNLAIRSEIHTGDEFEQLAETFNSMLADLQSGQDRLRSINAALDLKLHELAESNTALFQAAKIKGEFLANVSHELRTPLNSIIGFAELLVEMARADAEKDGGPAVTKRIRYLDNILTASRGLLALINSLLEMARIEAGRVELHLERMNLRDACEGLLGLIAPLAEKRGVALKLEVAEDVPVVRTDTKKFQQIIFNFLSNAVKFTEPVERTGRQPLVILRAERLVGAPPVGDGHPPRAAHDLIRVSVIDNGAGIPKEEQQRVFEKFYQLDGGHTREHTGTGLGLAICKELAAILQCDIQLVSEVGRGSMFSLIMPPSFGEAHAEESALEARFRGSLASGRKWD
jgi:two-component system sensor histidine kinase BarA